MTKRKSTSKDTGVDAISDEWCIKAREATAVNLKEPDRTRYLDLADKVSLTKYENEERNNLRARAHKWQGIRFWWTQWGVQSARQSLRNRPNGSSEAREFIRAVVSPCYPSFASKLIQQWAAGEHTPQSYTTPRQGLEGVLYAMDYTPMLQTLADPEQRVHFLSSLNMMLEPFRKLKNEPIPKLRTVKQPSLEKMFEFGNTKRGHRTRDRLDATLEEYGIVCFDVHILMMANVKKTPAIARVAASHNKTVGALTVRYDEWSTHPICSKVLQEGDSYAREIIAELHELIDIAYPIPLDIRSPHRIRK